MEIINIFLCLWIILIIYLLFYSIENKNTNKEGFTPKIRGMYHPHLRNFRLYTESFLNQYNDNYVIKKLKNLGIY
jgi:hypothetical protein